MYILYSTRLNGWMTSQGQYNSDWKQAKQFSFGEAIERCKLHTTGSSISVIPVAVSDIQDILA